MSNWISMASTFNEIVDCRMIQLELEYHQITTNQLTEIAQFCVIESNRLFSDTCFSKWKFCGRQRLFTSVLKAIQECKGDFDFSFDSDVKSGTVHNDKTFWAYDRHIQEESIGQWKAFSISHDYPGYFNNWSCQAENGRISKDVILQIINEPGRKKEAFWRQHDISGRFNSYSYINNDSIFRGRFTIRVALKCLGNCVDSFANSLVEMIKKAIVISPNISARISLSPISSPSPCSPHMLYFGGRVQEDNSHFEMGRLGAEWYPYYYFCGAEWFNMLSPLQVSHLGDATGALFNCNHIITTTYPNGAVSVQLKKAIDQIDVPDLGDVRKLLYQALYPGNSEIRLSNLLTPNAYGFLAKLRQEWECIPIFPFEIDVNDQRILFQHRRDFLK